MVYILRVNKKLIGVFNNKYHATLLSMALHERKSREKKPLHRAVITEKSGTIRGLIRHRPVIEKHSRKKKKRERKVIIEMYVPAAQLKELYEIAGRRGQTFSDIVRSTLLDFLLSDSSIDDIA